MGRRRKSFLRLKINSKTIFNISGFFLIAASVILLLSFVSVFSPANKQGRLMQQINENMTSRAGGLAIFVPFILLLISGHFFNTKKLRFVKANITGGIILVFIALLGLLRSGSLGVMIFANLSLDFSGAGAVFILLILMIIGLILFLDTSIDVLILFIIKIFKNLGNFVQTYVFRQLFSKKQKIELNNKRGRGGQGESAFIKDLKINEKSKPLVNTTLATSTAAAQHLAANKDFVIKPIAQSVSSTWIYPPLNLLMDISQKEAERGDVKHNAATIENTLESFGIRAHVAEVNYGPAVTQYALEIAMGTKLSKITALGNDLALALAAPTGTVRIEAPIPGRSLVGIEIPNTKPEIVTLKKMLSSEVFTKDKDPLLVPLGLDVSGRPLAASIGKMPHVLIAGTTGSGKSVILNAWISTFLFRTKPEELRMILVDPKRVELTLYNGIPHLMTEVVVEPAKIISALRWTVSEMENRYKEFAKVGSRNLDGYNLVEGVEKKPYIIFIIDELADLMIFAPGEAEELITRIAQMARATGIHLLLATQRPSVDVITGLMKANIPARVAFSVSSMIDSRVIIDMPGAEKLLGRGDMLFLPPDQAKPRRIQGPFLTEKEVSQLVRFLRSQTPEVHYTEEITQQETANIAATGRSALGSVGSSDKDPLFNKAIELVMQHDKASASLLQRRMSIGYARAARILDQLEEAGVVGPAEGSKPREVVRQSSEGSLSTDHDLTDLTSNQNN